MLAHDAPHAAVAVRPQDARKTLEVAVHDGVAKLPGGFLARRGHDAVPWEKGELGACSGRGQRRWMHTQPAQVAHNEACGHQGGARGAGERVL
jgi:hypothetical protein